jgi:hypothetical protein
MRRMRRMMRTFPQIDTLRGSRLKIAAVCRAIFFPAMIVAGMMGIVRPAAAQVAYSGDAGGFSLSAGVAASGYQVQYGAQKLLGITAIVDADTRSRLGIEAEGRWLQFHESNQQHATTYLIGPRYHLSRGRLQFYLKGLVGDGQFTFPYNYAKGSYFVVAPGGGVDYRWKRRVSIRLADVEYQYWPQFTYGAMNSYGISVGFRYHIF